MGTTETCPVFVMKGEEIVDVFYTEVGFGETGWVLENKSHPITTDADHLIIETPVGCKEAWMNMPAGQTLYLGVGVGPMSAPLLACQRIRPAATEPEAAKAAALG